MTYTRLEPVDPREAFAVLVRPDDDSTQSLAASQAAFLVALRGGVLGYDVESPDKGEFPLPELKSLRRTRHLRVAEAHAFLDASEKELHQESEPQLQREMARAVQALYQKPNIETAAALFEAAMRSPHPLVAVAGAAGARETTRLRKTIRKTLVDGARCDDRLASRLAEAAIGHIGPMEGIADERVIERPKSKKRHRKSDTAVITHGSFAADNPWYQPGGDFYEALAANRPDLHVHDESFTWTGSYSHYARLADAELLEQWIADQGLGAPDFFAHSHGGTVAHLATKRGVQFDRLVLMGWPAWDDRFPDFSKINRIIDIRVRFDLVILLDGGRQRFKTNQFNIEEHRHGWFNHSATHESDYWDDHDLWGVI